MVTFSVGISVIGKADWNDGRNPEALREFLAEFLADPV